MWWALLPTCVGLWLMAAPYVLGYLDTAGETNDRIVGPFVVCFAIISVGECVANVRYWNVLLGVWMLIAAFALGYPTAGIISALVSGVLLIALPFKRRNIATPYAGGWAVLFRKDPYDTAAGSADAPARPLGDRLTSGDTTSRTSA